MKKNGRQITKIQRDIFGAMVILTIIMTIITAICSIILNLKFEKDHLEDNLRHVAFTISNSVQIRNEISDADTKMVETSEYLDSFKKALSHVDVISIVSKDGTRLYHTSKDLVGTTYDGTIPDFDSNGHIYIASDIGPSGSQRRAYAAIYDENGEYAGFALVVLLNQNIYRIIVNVIAIHLVVAILVIAVSVLLSRFISRKIKHQLLGYEPDTISAMYSVRDNILESFEEGVIAIDYDEKILFMNKVAQKICGVEGDYSLNLKDYPILSVKDVRSVLKTSEHLVGNQMRVGNTDALVNYYPVVEDGKTIGAICVLIDRTEYTKIAEDLSGVKFLVESMRANNHDFTNKLHVILGLVQMGANKEAIEYISNITSIQQATISNVMRNFEDPSIAALLIGKYSRASELNITLNIETGSQYRRSDVSFNSNDLVTVIGNLVENAFEAMNSNDVDVRELTVGVFTKPGAVLIRVDDTGPGISEDIRDHVFDSGVTTKGEAHGSGLFLVKQIVNRYNGTIEFETETGVGTSFTVTLIEVDGGSKNV
ncbi:MAG: sensor histidine kinase [Clostridia bacterium]|nr:sensor histidine kinase [Clostridia bacterium]